MLQPTNQLTYQFKAANYQQQSWFTKIQKALQSPNVYFNHVATDLPLFLTNNTYDETDQSLRIKPYTNDQINDLMVQNLNSNIPGNRQEQHNYLITHQNALISHKITIAELIKIFKHYKDCYLLLDNQLLDHLNANYHIIQINAEQDFFDHVYPTWLKDNTQADLAQLALSYNLVFTKTHQQTVEYLFAYPTLDQCIQQTYINNYLQASNNLPTVQVNYQQIQKLNALYEPIIKLANNPYQLISPFFPNEFNMSTHSNLAVSYQTSYAGIHEINRQQDYGLLNETAETFVNNQLTRFNSWLANNIKLTYDYNLNPQWQVKATNPFWHQIVKKLPVSLQINLSRIMNDLSEKYAVKTISSDSAAAKQKVTLNFEEKDRYFDQSSVPIKRDLQLDQKIDQFFQQIKPLKHQAENMVINKQPAHPTSLKPLTKPQRNLSRLLQILMPDHPEHLTFLNENNHLVDLSGTGEIQSINQANPANSNQVGKKFKNYINNHQRELNHDNPF